MIVGGDNSCAMLALLVVVLVVVSDMEKIRARSSGRCGADCQKTNDDASADDAVAARAATNVQPPAGNKAAAAPESTTKEADTVSAPGDNMKRATRMASIQKSSLSSMNPAMDCPRAFKALGVAGPLQTALAFSQCDGETSKAKGTCVEDKLPSMTCMWSMAPPQLPMTQVPIDETMISPADEE